MISVQINAVSSDVLSVKIKKQRCTPAVLNKSAAVLGELALVDRRVVDDVVEGLEALPTRGIRISSRTTLRC